METVKDVKTIKELSPLVLDWANGISKITSEDSCKNYLNVLKNLGEVSTALEFCDNKRIEGCIGNLAVSIIIYYESKNEDIDLSDEEVNYVLDGHDSNIMEDIVEDLGNLEDTIISYLNDLCVKHGTTIHKCVDNFYKNRS